MVRDEVAQRGVLLILEILAQQVVLVQGIIRDARRAQPQHTIGGGASQEHFLDFIDQLFVLVGKIGFVGRLEVHSVRGCVSVGIRRLCI